MTTNKKVLAGVKAGFQKGRYFITLVVPVDDDFEEARCTHQVLKRDGYLPSRIRRGGHLIVDYRQRKDKKYFVTKVHKVLPAPNP